MEQVLINRKTLKRRKSMEQVQKASFRQYGRGHGAVVKARLGKLAGISGQEATKPSSKSVRIPDLSQEELLGIIRESRLTGMSGNDFPTAEKLESFIKNKREDSLLVVNAVECEPGLLHDEWLLEQYPDEIIAGIQILCKTLRVNQAVLAVKTNTGLERWEAGISGIKVSRVPARYPMGEEHILLRQLFGIQMDKTEHPAEKGFLVLNVQTVYQICQLCNGTYRKGRYVTLADIDTGEAKVVFAKNGEDIGEVLKSSFRRENGRECFAGGGILSAHLLHEGECFSNSISFAAIGTPAEISNENKCKGCGKCSRKCPMGVSVRELVKRREQNPNADITDLGLEKCIHCNTCTYFCRAGKNISAYLVSAE